MSGLGGLDILVSNAGRQQAHASILDISTEHASGMKASDIGLKEFLQMFKLEVLRHQPPDGGGPSARGPVTAARYLGGVVGKATTVALLTQHEGAYLDHCRLHDVTLLRSIEVDERS